MVVVVVWLFPTLRLSARLIIHLFLFLCPDKASLVVVVVVGGGGGGGGGGDGGGGGAICPAKVAVCSGKVNCFLFFIFPLLFSLYSVFVCYGARVYVRVCTRTLACVYVCICARVCVVLCARSHMCVCMCRCVYAHAYTLKMPCRAKHDACIKTLLFILIIFLLVFLVARNINVGAFIQKHPSIITIHLSLTHPRVLL